MRVSYRCTYRDLIAFNFHQIFLSPVFLGILGLILVIGFKPNWGSVVQLAADRSLIFRIIFFIVLELVPVFIMCFTVAVVLLLSNISGRNKTVLTDCAITQGDDLIVTESQYSRFVGLFGLLVLAGLAASTEQSKALAAPSSSGVIDLWGGAVESIALRADGTVWTWGWDDYGILGNAHGVTMFDPTTQFDSLVPSQVLGPGGVGHLTSIVAIAGGERHNAALDSFGAVWTWGWNAFGQLGDGNTCTSDPHSTDCMSATPLKIPGFSSVKAIASRGYHTLALKRDGTLWAWGLNDSGRLGDGTNIDRHSPVEIGGLGGHSGVLAISAGGDVSAVLMADHTLMAWGANANGAVGNGVMDANGQWTPTQVSQSTGLTAVKSIATGWDHMVALSVDGTVWTWGDNHDGQLGDGTATSSSLPLKVQGLSDVVGVSAGDGSTVVVKADGTVWAWGLIRHADGSDYSYGSTPVQVPGIDHVSLVRARDWHVLALKSDGTVWAWGSNQRGECGIGMPGGDTDAPRLVLFPDFLTSSLFLPALLR
jgi:alpha-tubulin suppressor-like RCC1 family protein